MTYKIFFNDDIDIPINALKEGKEKEFIEAFISILEYDPETGEIPESMENNWFFNFYRRRVDKSFEKSKKKIETNRENGKKGGRPKKENSELKILKENV